jgi:transposase
MKDELLENMVVTLNSRGWALREIARKLVISRGRVRRIMERNRYKREKSEDSQPTRAQRTSLLDTYKEYITELLDQYKDPPITNQRILELIREKGYQGGKTILGDYLTGVRGKKTGDPVVCVETTPGQRGSHDWSEYYIWFSDVNKKEKVIFFSFILNYSRRQYIEVVDDKTQVTLLKCLVNTFTYFDGVVRQVKSDNQKPCVDRWELGRAIFNKKYLEFASHYHFTPLTITPGKPRENLKIERPFYYLEMSFLNGRSFCNGDDLKRQLTYWLENTNDRRVHRTTRQTPLDLYLQEYPYLQPLPKKQYDTALSQYRIVNNESCIEWQGYFYVVPKAYMHQTCQVREDNGLVKIYDSTRGEIIRYPVADKGSADRYIGRIPREQSESHLRIKEIISRLESMGSVMEEYIAQVKMYKSNSFRHHLSRILQLKVTYQKEDILVAVSRALKYKVYESSSIENFLHVNAEKKNEITLFQKNSSYDED